jgi:hypothetical protein
MNDAVAGAAVAHSCGYAIPLLASGSLDCKHRSDSIPIAVATHQLQLEPVPCATGDVFQHQRRLIQPCDHGIHPSVPIEVSERDATVERWSGKRLRRKGAISSVQKQEIGLSGLTAGSEFRIVLDVAAGYESVLPAIVVEVVQADTPAGPRKAGGSDAARGAEVGELAAADVPQQGERLIGQSGDEGIFTAVVIVIAKVETHGRDGIAILVVGDAGGQALLAERAVALVVKQEVGHRIVRDHHVQPPIAVVVSEGQAHAFAKVSGDARLARDVAKGSISLVME